MFRPILIAVVAALALCSTSVAQDKSRRADTTIGFSAADAEMNAAIAEARRTLPIFWKLFDSDPVVADTAKVKVKVEFDTPGEGPEHLWFTGLRRERGVLIGVLDNRPAMVRGMQKGDVMTIDESRISDWRYIRDGRMYGGFTTRVMVPKMTPEQQAMFLSVLSDEPLEDVRP